MTEPPPVMRMVLSGSFMELDAVLVRFGWVEDALPAIGEIEVGHAQHEQRIVTSAASAE